MYCGQSVLSPSRNGEDARNLSCFLIFFSLVSRETPSHSGGGSLIVANARPDLIVIATFHSERRQVWSVPKSLLFSIPPTTHCSYFLLLLLYTNKNHILRTQRKDRKNDIIIT